MVAYVDHVLVYNMIKKDWAIWPLGIRSNAADAAPTWSRTFSCVSILSDESGVYLVSGIQDLNDTLSDNPFTESPSYYICELGFGGARDRSIREEDRRGFGIGTFELLEPTQDHLGNAANLKSPGAGLLKNGHVNHITPIKEWRVGSTAYKSYQIDFEVVPEVLYPQPNTYLKLTLPAAWSFVQASTGCFAEWGPFSAFTVTYPAANEITAYVPSLLAPNNDRLGSRTPWLYIEISSLVTSVVDPKFTVVWADSDVGGSDESNRVIAWQAVDRFRFSNNRWASGSYSIDGAAAHEQDVEWAFKSGELNLNGNAVIRVRGIRAALESAGAAAVTGYEGLYNVTVASDYKLMSGQWVDYNDPAQAEREALKKQTLRDRMYTGKRIFNSVATWYRAADGVVNTNYLHDNPEVDEIDISMATKGESLSAMLFGRVTDKAESLRLHRAKAEIQVGGKPRRYGR